MEDLITQDAGDIVPFLFTVDEMLTWAIVRGTPASRDETEWMCSRVCRNPACVLLSELDHNGLLEPDAYLLTGGIWSTSEYPDVIVDHEDWGYLFGQAGYTVDGVRAAYPDTPVQPWWACKRTLTGWSIEGPRGTRSSAYPSGACVSLGGGDARQSARYSRLS